MKHENLLIVADSERDADMLYATRVRVPDPFIYLKNGERSLVIVSDLEIDRVRRHAEVDRVISLNEVHRCLQRNGVDSPRLEDVVALICRQKRIRKLVVPASFPLGLARRLRERKLKLKPRDGWFFPDREFKTTDEVKMISAALIMAEVGMAEGIHALRRAKIARNGRLLLNGVALTAEKLRAVIDAAILHAGGLPAHTIVACGRKSCDPHERGYGPLRANAPVILDLFPRSQRTGYYGDITRTVVRGKASEMLRRQFDVVRQAQELAFGKMRAGTKCAEVHQAVVDCFEKEGYRSGRRDGRMFGYFHGTGHGLGLEIHEPPRTNGSSKSVLTAGHVVTVEPGLYYPGVGGVRLEDVALVTTGAPRNLTRFEKVLEV